VKIARLIAANIAVTFFLALAAQAQTPSVIAIRAGHLFDSKSGKLLNNQVILVKEEKILAVGAADTIQIPPDAQIIDLTKNTVLPGLMEAGADTIEHALELDQKTADLIKKKGLHLELTAYHYSLSDYTARDAKSTGGKYSLEALREKSGRLAISRGLKISFGSGVGPFPMSVSKTIPIHGSVHNIFVTPDDRYAVTGSIEAKIATVIDLRSEQVAWEIKFDGGVRPIAFEAYPDGSTKRMFVQLNDVNGFAVVDFAKHKEVARILFPKDQERFGAAEQRQRTPSHGIRVSPDGRVLWVNSTLSNATYKYSLPDLKLVGFCELPLVYPANRPVAGAVPDWIAIVHIARRGRSDLRQRCDFPQAATSYP